MELLLNKGSFQSFYHNIYAKKKERFEMILEPLQAILQLALLSFCPKGTKITINQNILQLQMPYYTQGILRWYQNDNKDDLFYLFYVCKRFSRFYGHLKQIRVFCRFQSVCSKRRSPSEWDSHPMRDIYLTGLDGKCF